MAAPQALPPAAPKAPSARSPAVPPVLQKFRSPPPTLPATDGSFPGCSRQRSQRGCPARSLLPAAQKARAAEANAALLPERGTAADAASALQRPAAPQPAQTAPTAPLDAASPQEKAHQRPAPPASQHRGQPCSAAQSCQKPAGLGLRSPAGPQKMSSTERKTPLPTDRPRGPSSPKPRRFHPFAGFCATPARKKLR